MFLWLASLSLSLRNSFVSCLNGTVYCRHYNDKIQWTYYCWTYNYVMYWIISTWLSVNVNPDTQILLCNLPVSVSPTDRNSPAVNVDSVHDGSWWYKSGINSIYKVTRCLKSANSYKRFIKTLIVILWAIIFTLIFKYGVFTYCNTLCCTILSVW